MTETKYQSMKTNFPLFLILIVIFAFSSCEKAPPTDLTKTPFIPKPVSVTATGESFKLSANTTISVEKGLEQKGQYLADQINQISGITIPVKTVEKAPKKGIFLSPTGKTETGDEGYILNIGKKLIEIDANKQAGILNGIQPLLQILPVKSPESSKSTIATGEITDNPEYKHRLMIYW